MNRKLLELREQQARLAIDTMHRAVVDQFPIGMLVDYEYGGRWVGTCRVTGHRYRAVHYGPQIIVVNLKTGKERAICSHNFVRPTESRS